MILYHSGQLGHRKIEEVINVIMYHSGSKGRLADESLKFLQAELGTTGLPTDMAAIMLQGRCRLITYAEIINETLLMKEVEVLIDMHPKLALDSGAFSVMNSGITIDIDVYAKFLKEHGGMFTWYANLDVIPIDDTHTVAAAQASLDNLLHLENNHGLTPMPIFHFGEPIEFLDRLQEGRTHIGLGGLVGVPRASRLPWLETVFGHVNEGVRVHGYGIGDEVILKGFPWHSIDSTNWLTACRFGTWPPFHSGIYTLTARVLPWVEYLDGMCAALDSEYEGKEDEDQASLFKTTSMDRTREQGPQNIGPAAAVWPGDDFEKGKRAADLIAQGPRPTPKVAVKVPPRKPQRTRAATAPRRRTKPVAVVVPVKVLTDEEKDQRRRDMDAHRAQQIAKEKATKPKPFEDAGKHDGVRCTCSPLGRNNECPRHGVNGTEVGHA
jgi:hypothetical protein